MKEIVLITISIAGFMTVLASILGWEWIYKSRRAKAVVQVFGINGARIIYGIIGLVLLLSPIIYAVLSPINHQAETTLNTLSVLSVDQDGCTVSRTAIESKLAVGSEQWVITDSSDNVVLERGADDEYTYRYFRSGNYSVVLQAWFNGRYVEISNKVNINCP